MVPSIRIRRGNDAPPRPDREFVLYWMIAARRTRHHFGLQRAAEIAAETGRPLLVLEPLRLDYRWASPRFHRFVVEGMADQERAFARAGVTYHPYVEPESGAGRGLLAALARRACTVVTDEYPTFFLPRMVAAAAGELDVRVEVVDSNGLLPLRASDRAFPTAHAFRRHLQRTLPDHLLERPLADPLAGMRELGAAVVPPDVAERWPAARLSDPGRLVDRLPLPAGPPAPPVRGGESAARKALAGFLGDRLPRYGADRNHPDRDGSSGLSPWLHFGHLSAHEIAAAALESDGWSPTRLSPGADGSRSGWWGASEPVESFLDELVTWRELGYGFCYHRPEDHDRYGSLPDWARRTLDEHAGDPRPHLYGPEQLETAETHDPIWNAAQRQLLHEGRIHNYLRMLWGKKILEWTPTPRHALEVMTDLNHRYALDGRDPNSWSGIFWVLGRFDRAWGPVRPIFGKVRYMSSDSTARKLRLREYLARWSAEAQPTLF